ncbi:MAG: hypothetical protein ABI895_19340 [Deltaproteobacteria bacterium]
MIRLHFGPTAWLRLARVIRPGLTLLALLAAVPGCGSGAGNSGPGGSGDGGSAAASGPGEPFVRFSSPEQGATLSGQAELRYELAAPGEPDELRFGVGDRELQALQVNGGSIVVNTTAFENGEQELHLELVDTAGQVWRDTLAVRFDNPSQRLLVAAPRQVRHRNGDELAIDLEYNQPGLRLRADLSALDSRFAEGRMSIEEQGEGKYVLRYPLSSDNQRADGDYAVAITSEAAAPAARGTNRSLVSRVSVPLENTPRLPIEVEGAALVQRADPGYLVGQQGAPRVTSVTGRGDLLSGGVTELQVTWEDTAEHPTDKIVVRAPGYSGYYVFPAPADTHTATLRIHLPPVPEACPGGVCPKRKTPAMNLADGLLDLEVAALDEARRAFETQGFGLYLLLVGTGGVQASLTWDSPVDLDLSVVDPTGKLLDFETPVVGSGELDLDTNALCQIGPNFAENIFWSEETHPFGEYVVRANLFDACGQASVNYRVVVIACGTSQEYKGMFSAADVDQTGTGTEVARVTVDCRRRVTGRITFHTEPAGEALSGPKPAADFPVRVVPIGSTTPLKVGTTNADGVYDIRFDDLALRDYRVEVEASWTDPVTKRLQAKVVPLAGGDPYRIPSPPILRADDADQQIAQPDDAEFRLPTRRVDLDILPADNSAALNILDRMRLGFAWLADNVPAQVRTGGKTLPREQAYPPLTVRWTNRGVPPDDGTYYVHGERTIYVQDLERGPNPDESRDQFDDDVLLHEFMHYVLFTGSFSAPGGKHNGLPGPPDLAFSEGLASALAMDAIGKDPPRFQDRWLLNSSTMDLELESAENLDTGSPVRTTPGAGVKDKIPEFVVAAIVWDLLDGTGDDPIAGPRGSTLGALFSYLPTQSAAKLASRGVNGVDLVDYLDAWRCTAGAGTSLDTAIGQMLAAVGGFPYDFAPVPGVCQ